MTITNMWTGTHASRNSDALIVVIRTPKSASSSLAVIVSQAFSGARAFILPNTLKVEGAISTIQQLRHIRHTARINYRWHRLLRLDHVFKRINREANPGDIVTGGHIDFDTCRANLKHPVKFITLVRNPVDRSLSEYAYARAGYRRKHSLHRFDASLVAKAAGRYSFEGYLDFLADHRAAFGDITCRYVGLRSGEDIAAHFAAHAYHFGTVENLTAFARGLAAKSGQVVEERHLNPTRAPRVTPTSGERRKIENLYARDFELYDWCRAQEARPLPRPVLSLASASA